MSSSQSHLNYLVPQPMHAGIFLAGIWPKPRYFILDYVAYYIFSWTPFLVFFMLFCRDASTAGLVKVRRTYPFGVDPVWHGTRSELPFLNSLKMKMSILIGVAQMNLGIILSYFNAKFFQNGLNIWWVIYNNFRKFFVGAFFKLLRTYHSKWYLVIFYNT